MRELTSREMEQVSGGGDIWFEIGMDVGVRLLGPGLLTIGIKMGGYIGHQIDEFLDMIFFGY